MLRAWGLVNRSWGGGVSNVSFTVNEGYAGGDRGTVNRAACHFYCRGEWPGLYGCREYRTSMRGYN